MNEIWCCRIPTALVGKRRRRDERREEGVLVEAVAEDPFIFEGDVLTIE